MNRVELSMIVGSKAWPRWASAAAMLEGAEVLELGRERRMTTNMIRKLTTDITAALRAMDEEAETVINGVRAGLVDFAGHRGIRTKTYEVPIYRRLGELLRESGRFVLADHPYADGSGRVCDLVVHDEGQARVWIEVKVIWRHWLSSDENRPKSWDDPSYVLGPRGGRARDHSLAQDFEKLESIDSASATHLLVLAIGFDSTERSLDGWMQQLIAQEELPKRSWSAEPEAAWGDRNNPSFRIRKWQWWKALSLAGPSGEQPKSQVERLTEHLARVTTDEPVFFQRAEARLNHYRSMGSNEWYWEDWIADVLELPVHHSLVRCVGADVRKFETPYTASKYSLREGRHALIRLMLELARSEASGR